MRFITLLTAALLVMAGCNDPEEPNYLVEYPISMNSMAVEPLASPDDPLAVRLTGVIGPDTSYWYDHAVISESASTYEITLFGIHNVDPAVSYIATLVEWRGREFLKQPPHADTVRVIFHQPDGAEMVETVAVRP